MSSPVNPIKQRPVEPIFAELQQKGFDPTGPFAIAIRDLITRSDKTVTNAGTIQPQAPIGSAQVGIGTTTQNLTDTGTVTAAGVGFTLTAVPDDPTFQKTTPNQVAGAGRAFVALDTNARLANSFRANPVNVSNTPTSATVLSNAGGGATLISVAASTAQFGNGTISYNAGSVDPGVTGTFFVFADDPTFAGGAVTYQFSTSAPSQTASDSRVNFGKITTSGTASTGGGSTGGTTPGGGGGRGFNNG